jgi:hypothetical protein
VAELAAQYQSASSGKTFVEKFSGDEGDFHAHVMLTPHAAAPLLKKLQVIGAPVVPGTPLWSMQKKQQALERGPHQSANAQNAFLRGEFAEMIRKKQWILLPEKVVITE